VKPNINSVEVHPHLSNSIHPVDGVMVGAGSLWPKKPANPIPINELHVTAVFFLMGDEFSQISKFKEKIARFLKQDPADSQNTKGFLKAFLLSYLVYSQIWLNLLFVDER
jgi:hypothetical protein